MILMRPWRDFNIGRGAADPPARRQSGAATLVRRAPAAFVQRTRENSPITLCATIASLLCCSRANWRDATSVCRSVWPAQRQPSIKSNVIKALRSLKVQSITGTNSRVGKSALRFSKWTRPIRMEFQKMALPAIQDYELDAIMTANAPAGMTWKRIIYNNPDSPNGAISKLGEAYLASAIGQKMWER
jgi:hypothetical protein